MSSEPVFVLPGDHIPPDLVPSHPKKPLRLGPGLRHVPPNDVVPTLAGQFVTDRPKNAIRVENSHGRVSQLLFIDYLSGNLANGGSGYCLQYVPRVGELVIGTIHKTAADVYYVHLSDYTAPVILPQLSFESATKKTRPVLAPGALVYARVTLANKHMDAELECVSSSTGKSDGLGPLTGGMMFGISLGMARRLMMPKSVQEGKIVVLEELGALGLQFDTATGRNGRFWVDSENTKTVLAVGRAIQETDERRLGVEDQKKLVRKIIKDLS
ncbi:hypothetical protein MANI_017085 [Metarhizium anisopliae]